MTWVRRSEVVAVVVGRVGPWRMALVGAAAVLVAALGGCGQYSGSGQISRIQDVAAQQALAKGMAEALGHPTLTVSPPNGASGVSPSELVTATVTGGQLTQATLRERDGATLDGVISPDGQRWTSSKPLKPTTSYVFTTVVRSLSGEESTTDTTFTTIAPGQQVNGKITPPDGGTISLATPLTIDFDKPIGDRAAVERALAVSVTPPAKGSARWRSDKQLVWQPDLGWEPGSQVIATLNFFGRQVGPNLFGGGDLRSAFRVEDLTGAGVPDQPGDAPPPSLDPAAPNLAAAPGAPGPSGLAAAGAPGTAPGQPAPGVTPPGAPAPAAPAPGASAPGAPPRGAARAPAPSRGGSTAASAGRSGATSRSSGSGTSRDAGTAAPDAASSGNGSDSSSDSSSDDNSDSSPSNQSAQPSRGLLRAVP